MERALGDRALAEEAGHHLVAAALPLRRHGEPDRQRQAAADDRIAAVEGARGVETGASIPHGRGCSPRPCRTSPPSRWSSAPRGPARGRARDRWRRPGRSRPAPPARRRRSPPPRYRGAGSRGSFRRSRARRRPPRTGGCGSCAPAGRAGGRASGAACRRAGRPGSVPDRREPAGLLQAGRRGTRGVSVMPRRSPGSTGPLPAGPVRAP